MHKVFRALTLRGATSAIRSAKYQEREHIVIPIVAMVEGVIRPWGSKVGEFVSAERLARSALSWNGRPVVVNHPMVSGIPVSANDPRILEQECVGTLFNSKFTDAQLHTEAWVDVDRVKPDTPAMEILDDFRAQKPVEISIGAHVSYEERAGEYKGKSYGAVWHDILSDHLALLPRGTRGACNNEMGCGPIHVLTACGLEIEGDTIVADMPLEPKTLREKFLEMLGLKAKDDLSDREIRRALEKALYSTEPAFLGVESIFPLKDEVIYYVGADDKIQLYQRSYKLKGTEVTLKDDRQAVERVEEYKPVAAEAAPELVAAGCGCGGQGEGAMNREQRIAALIGKGRFTEADRTWLNAVPEDRLSVLEQEPSPQQPPQTPPPQPQTPPQTPPQQPPPAPPNTPTVSMSTADQYIGSLPAHEQIELREALRINTERKTELVQALKTNQHNKFTETELLGMPLGQLEKLAALAGAPETPTFLGRPVPRAASGDNEKVDPPPSMVDAIKAARSGK